MKLSVTSCAALVEALTAVNRTVVLRLERNLRLLAAISANNFVHLALLTALASLTTLSAAVRAAGRLILEAFLSIKSLLTSGEREFLATLFACQCLVLKFHCSNPLTDRIDRRGFLITITFLREIDYLYLKSMVGDLPQRQPWK